jgi:hypothetical protein
MKSEIIDTLCGKNMKLHMYKYHQKKCNICKGQNHDGINVEFFDNFLKRTHGCAIKDLSKKKYKKEVNFGGKPNKKDEEVFMFNYFKDNLDNLLN